MQAQQAVDRRHGKKRNARRRGGAMGVGHGWGVWGATGLWRTMVAAAMLGALLGLYSSPSAWRGGRPGSAQGQSSSGVGGAAAAGGAAGPSATAGGGGGGLCPNALGNSADSVGGALPPGPALGKRLEPLELPERAASSDFGASPCSPPNADDQVPPRKEPVVLDIALRKEPLPAPPLQLPAAFPSAAPAGAAAGLDGALPSQPNASSLRAQHCSCEQTQAGNNNAQGGSASVCRLHCRAGQGRCSFGWRQQGAWTCAARTWR